MEPGLDPRVCLVQPNPCSPTETFIQAHADHLPAQSIVIAGSPAIDGRPLMPARLVPRAWRKAMRVTQGLTWYDDLTSAYLQVFRHYRPDAVLAEYGGTGVLLVDACRAARMPLVVHFHGFDASQTQYLTEMGEDYRRMFQESAALIAVSHAMRQQLIELGAPAEKVYWNPYGIDCKAFGGADAAAAPPIFLSVARFCEKKAPHLTLQAFAQVHSVHPDVRLRMVGAGPLLEPCMRLAEELAISDAVTFLGVSPPHVVQDEMRQARCLVQHSLVASDGETEGTPVSILEAGASGLPVVSTRHAGIPDVVLEGKTGFLVDEGDVLGMAERMRRLAGDPAAAGEMGRTARAWIETEFSMSKRIGILRNVIRSCVETAVVATPKEAVVASRS